MNNLQKLKQQVQAIEESIDEEMSVEELYEKLIVAYNLQKDIIASTEDPSMEILEDVTALKDVNDHMYRELAEKRAKVRSLNTSNTTLNAEVIKCAGTITDLKEQVRVLTHWQDGTNAEGELLKAELTALTTENSELENRVNKYTQLLTDLQSNTNAAINTLNNSKILAEQLAK